MEVDDVDVEVDVDVDVDVEVCPAQVAWPREILCTAGKSKRCLVR